MTVARRSLLAGGTAGVGLVVAGAVPSLAEAAPAPRRSPQPSHRPFPPLLDDRPSYAIARNQLNDSESPARPSPTTATAPPRRTMTAPRSSRPSATACD